MKKTWLLVAVAALLIVVAACGKEEENASDVDGNTSTPPALLTFETDANYDAAAKQLVVRVSMTNPNDVPVNVTFNSSQRFQLMVMNGETTVFDYGSEYMFTESIIEETWEAGETKVFDETFPLDLAAGDYTADFVGLGQVEGAPEMAVTDQTRFTVEATEAPAEESSEEATEEAAEESGTETTEGPQTDGDFRDVTIKRNGTLIEVSGFTDVEEFEWSISDGHMVYAEGAAQASTGDFVFGALLDEEPTEGQSLFLELLPIGGDVTAFRIQ
ncbi:BsuPI-related putative proteinase inhibitor [Exiguobacterium alkaliphilum]|uniref:BsuPI-related putative proteinase inhibitor n=1 Tax=Exiguobacterium alkaliphilum TaxID=1428684 RepID=UPI00403AACD3